MALVQPGERKGVQGGCAGRAAVCGRQEPVEPGPDTGDSGEPEPEAEDTGGDPTLDPNDPRNKDGGGELSSCGGCAAGAPAGGALSALTLGVLALAGRRRKH